MSLDARQRRTTAAELQQNLHLAGLSAPELAERMGMEVGQVEAALGVEDADPRTVWAVRDAVETAAREAGVEPVPFTVLTEQNRAAARMWFGI